MTYIFVSSFTYVSAPVITYKLDLFKNYAENGIGAKQTRQMFQEITHYLFGHPTWVL